MKTLNIGDYVFVNGLSWICTAICVIKETGPTGTITVQVLASRKNIPVGYGTNERYLHKAVGYSVQLLRELPDPKFLNLFNFNITEEYYDHSRKPDSLNKTRYRKNRSRK